MVKDGEGVNDGDDCKAGDNNNRGRSNQLDTENFDGDGIIQAVARRADDEGNFPGHDPVPDTGTVDNDNEDGGLKIPAKPEAVKTPLTRQGQYSHASESAQAEVYHDHVAAKQEIETENGVVIGDITFTSHKASEINSNLQPAIFY
ncbi:hypothetical protein B0O99DRAFT_588379 [Bisporella sp. PMI_857]|nr:hypothetical protein B0O99DRAFT_588379 [Bisporella sp. PMI_857]